MTGIFENARFITTEFSNYFAEASKVWGRRRPKFYQHTDLVPCEGLPMFARDFEAADVKNARLYFTSLGCAEIFINGKRVGTDEMKPGWTDYNKRTLYREYDVSSYLTKGKNRVLAVVSPGWYTGRIAGDYYGKGTPALLLKIVTGENTVCTDGTWLACVGGPIRTADIWDGEYRDGGETDYTVLSSPDFALEGWKKARVTAYKGKVTPFVGSSRAQMLSNGPFDCLKKHRKPRTKPALKLPHSSLSFGTDSLTRYTFIIPDGEIDQLPRLLKREAAQACKFIENLLNEE